MKIAGEDFSPYKKQDELWVIVVYYNPCGYKSRRSTYDAFIKTMHASGINTVTVECAFKDDPFELPESPNVIKIKSDTLLWQKERLINIGASYLPDECKYIAWIDCDVIFENKNWAVETCELLQNSYTVVQLFQTCLRLEKGNVVGDTADTVTSFAEITTKDISTLDCGHYAKHGHTGYAWAMRRDVFDAVGGLYEYAVSGSADHFMAHAIYDSYNFCIVNALKYDQRQISHLKSWGNLFHKKSEGKLGVVSGNIKHLWHGTNDRRNYFKRMWIITEHGFNPDTDILAMPGRPLEWQPHVCKNKAKLVSYFGEYFASREEDTA